MNAVRSYVTPSPLPADNNIRRLYPVQDASWIAHPDASPETDSFCSYSVEFTLEADAEFTIHATADQRFELFMDDRFIGMGPDRSDLEHWSFHSYAVTLASGLHRLRAEVSFLAEWTPAAQISLRPGFLLACTDCPVDVSTGSAPWRVAARSGVSTAPAGIRTYHVVGPDFTIDGRQWFAAAESVEPEVIGPAGDENSTGIILPGWRLHPASLPEQTRLEVRGGQVRFAGEWDDGAPLPPAGASPRDRAMHVEFQALVDGGGRLTIPANSRVDVLWDMDEYHSAYPSLTLSGGRSSRVDLHWAEALYEDDPAGGDNARNKGNRDEVEGKFFVGYGDTFVADGGDRRVFSPPWWRAGRYIRISVVTADDALAIDDLHLVETRMPVENEGSFTSNDDALQSIIPIAVRGIQMCSHETYMDCPYYEQLMYVGDTRLQMLVSFVMSGEDRLNRRAIELFDWSRRETGFILERFPSTPRQLSTTFSMVWVLMLRDYAFWRDDAPFVATQLKGMRQLLEEFRSHTRAASADDAPLLSGLPGWSFMDWVTNWKTGIPADGSDGISAPINLLFLNALLAAADLEEHTGDAGFADNYRRWAADLALAVRDRFWHEELSLFADDVASNTWSEHSQCLALLSGSFPDLDERCFAALAERQHDPSSPAGPPSPSLEETTVYFSFYLFEVFAKFGRTDLMMNRLGLWKDMARNGFRTPIESPEPSRSDCHAWGSHPLFHMHASLAGIRPAEPGFRSVRIAPQPAGLTTLRSRIPHPAGEVSVAMERSGDGWDTRISLPDGIAGTLVWGDETHDVAGTVSLRLQDLR